MDDLKFLWETWVAHFVEYQRYGLPDHRNPKADQDWDFEYVLDPEKRKREARVHFLQTYWRQWVLKWRL